ncbi:MAG: hypothetical protein H6R00_3506 [Proteobacteria bacterium]|nr:hypothetical protein [Pseudomonadota bacterium]
MIRWVLKFVVGRLIFMGLFLLALNAFTRSSNCRYGNPQGLMQKLAGLPEALRTLSHSIR